ncbi:hypothetical protein [Erythrobacter sp.]|uniref:hypothetical protein n=1 Tax=Erythrobacter sp. TaxID=1042 RepID=UPI0025F39D6D|nr:hypothetical protein [Erythrobacter sp.]
MKRLFVKALIHAVLWTAWIFGAFAFLNWIGLADYTLSSLPFWIGMAAVMTLATMFTIPLDERWAKRRDRTKRMKDRNFQ